MINRSIKPGESGKIHFVLPEIEKFTLENGLEVYFVKRSNLPILRFNLIWNAGSRLDSEGKKGLANLFSLMIDEGAGEYNALELNEEFDVLGSNFDINCNNDNVFISLRTLKENSDRSLKLFSDVITKPHFNDEAFAREKRKILTRMLQINDDPDEIANIVFEYYLFGKENVYAYPVIGYKDDVQNISNYDLKNFYNSSFSPVSSALIVVGDTERSEINEKLNYYFKDWRPAKPLDNIIRNGNNEENRIFLVNKPGAVQSEIRVGHLSTRRNTPDYFNKTILNTVLGGQFTSRINLNLRENKGYTYGAFSRFNYYRDAGYFFVSTSVNAENTGNAVAEIINELRNIRYGITGDELNFAKASLVRKFPSNFETNRQIAANISAMIIHSLDDDYFDYYLDNIEQISAEDVNKTAAGNIFPDDTVIAIVGDRKKIRSQLTGFGRDIVDINIPVI